MSHTDLSPAATLQGHKLEGGWNVIRRFERNPDHSGGRFSCSYLVKQDDGKQAFLKALDFSDAIAADDPARALGDLTNAFNFERDLLGACKSRRMSRVVQVLVSGKTYTNPQDPFSVVQYLIFELADGDIRFYIDNSGAFDEAWALRTLHHAAVGLKQLHGSGIAHQDLKPSNLLVFTRDGCSKIADLGCASQKGQSSPRESLKIAGDCSYAPPELLYGHADPDWGVRRIGCDMYLLGSLVMFFFARTSATATLTARLPKEQQWKQWAGSFEEVLPYLQVAFESGVTEFCRAVPNYLRRDVKRLVLELCNPDPRHRGNPRRSGMFGTPLALEGYVSELDVLATRAEFRIPPRSRK